MKTLAALEYFAFGVSSDLPGGGGWIFSGTSYYSWYMLLMKWCLDGFLS